MDQTDVLGRLTRGEIVAMPAAEWEALRVHFAEVARRDTEIAGIILVMRGPSGLVLVEEPTAELRALRPVANEVLAEAFIQKRLAQYDRLFDGCGLRIDYYR